MLPLSEEQIKMMKQESYSTTLKRIRDMAETLLAVVHFIYKIALYISRHPLFLSFLLPLDIWQAPESAHWQCRQDESLPPTNHTLDQPHN